MGGAYSMVVDEDDDGGLSANLLDGVEVSHGVHLVEASVDPHAGARPPGADGLVGLALELTAAALAPLLQEGLLLSVAAAAQAILVGLAAATAAGARVGVGLGAVEAEDAAASGADAVHPLVTAGGLVVAGIVDDTLDAGRVVGVEGDGGQLQLRGSGSHAHGGVYLGVAELVFLVEVLVDPDLGVVTILGVQGLAMGVLGDEIVELVLGCGGGHGGRVWWWAWLGLK